MFRLFGITSEKPYIEINDSRTYYFYDPPHLLKSLRNNLLKHDLSVGEKPVKWQYIADFFQTDHSQTVKLAPKLTRRHIDLPPFANMRVRLAAQVLSHSVAAEIYTHVALGGMPSEAVHTAEFLDRVDSLFDCYNSGSFGTTKLLRKPLTARGKQWDFLKECKELLAFIKGCKQQDDTALRSGFHNEYNFFDRSV